MKPLKPTFFIAIAVILGLLPQSAQASCSGNACSSFSVENKSYSPSDKKLHATLVNKDQSKKIRLKGCMVFTKVSSYCWDVSIDPGKRETVYNGLDIFTKPEEAAKNSNNFVVDVMSAEFLPQVAAPNPPSAPAKAPDIKITVVNGDSVGLIVTLNDADSNQTVVNRMLGINNTIEVTLDNKGGKGHLKGGVYTLREGQSSSMLRFNGWLSYNPYQKGENVVQGGNYFVALKPSTNVKPPNAEYWQGVSDPNRANSGAPPARCGEVDGYFATGAKVTLKTSHVCE